MPANDNMSLLSHSFNYAIIIHLIDKLNLGHIYKLRNPIGQNLTKKFFFNIKTKKIAETEKNFLLKFMSFSQKIKFSLIGFELFRVNTKTTAH